MLIILWLGTDTASKVRTGVFHKGWGPLDSYSYDIGRRPRDDP